MPGGLALGVTTAHPLGVKTITIIGARDAYWYAHANFYKARSALSLHPDDPVLKDQYKMMLGLVSAACARMTAVETKELARIANPLAIAAHQASLLAADVPEPH